MRSELNDNEKRNDDEATCPYIDSIDQEFEDDFYLTQVLGIPLF